ncbi:MAG: ATP-binding cassette domain-containing protein [Deltaproteobacteria bacterium]|nr:ATP-binding cassette domain-containing protein [Deltaproteobacteria bacterium]
MEPFIRFEKIQKAFDEKVIYTDLTLDIQKGETITIIGGSGTGKSVMLKLLLVLMKPDAGKIFFDGKNVLEIPNDELITVRKRVGMLFQGGALFDSMTVFDNVAYPLYEHYKDYSDEKVAKIVHEKLEVIGLPDTADMMPADLSGGMKKRIALARAIATDPEVILYDEPTTGLDPTNTNRINDLILDLQKKFKVTSLVVTHDMNSAFKVSNRLALLYDKKIEFIGTKAEIDKSDNEVVRKFIDGQIGE